VQRHEHRRAFADDGLAADDCRLAIGQHRLGLGGAHGGVDGGGIVTIDRGDHMPAIGCKACRRVVGEPAFDMAIDRDAVVVIEGNQL
jgi:hypothetical protein